VSASYCEFKEEEGGRSSSSVQGWIMFLFATFALKTVKAEKKTRKNCKKREGLIPD